ncbi:uncharacterized protein LOC134237472 [Saccostrea cucullata]|uniref:uncharacterized protein LOC134237472 n=1 Tax=Saccostrea cuccullata TaxID=36930 RepID=UPI002ED5A811
MCDKLVNIGSTQNNESFNRTVASKNPKSHFYGGSESTAFRVASAVAQRNDGAGFISKVYENLLLSPGENTARYIEKENRKREYHRQQKQSIKYKKRRRELKCTMTQQVSTSEIKEGATYQPAVDLEPSDMLTEEIPSQLQPPTSSAHIVQEAKNTFLYFDLETTGLGTESSIVELACVYKDNIFHRVVCHP